jgi:hypothetical protein
MILRRIGDWLSGLLATLAYRAAMREMHKAEAEWERRENRKH